MYKKIYFLGNSVIARLLMWTKFFNIVVYPGSLKDYLDVAEQEDFEDG